LRTIGYKEIAELAGIIAVVCSLIFVGLELRQTSAVARMEANNNFVADMAEGMRQLALSPELSQLVADISGNNKQLSNLTRQEWMQIRTWYMSTLMSWNGLFQNVQEDILDGKYLATIGGGGQYNNDSFRQLWPGMKPVFSEEFGVFFETLSWNTQNSQ
jgi:hypothetical protein